MIRIRHLQEHLNRWMLVYVSLAIVIGLVVGHLLEATTKSNSGTIGNLTTVAVFFIIYPMMVNVRFEALLKAGRNLRGIGIAILFNFVWAPLVGWVLATIFLSDSHARARLPAGHGRSLFEHGHRLHGLVQGRPRARHGGRGLELRAGHRRGARSG